MGFVLCFFSRESSFYSYFFNSDCFFAYSSSFWFIDFRLLRMFERLSPFEELIESTCLIYLVSKVKGGLGIWVLVKWGYWRRMVFKWVAIGY